MNLLTLIFVLAGIWLFLVLLMVIVAVRENKRKVKQIDHAHKVESSSTLLDPESIPVKDLDLFECQRPFIEFRAGCN